MDRRDHVDPASAAIEFHFAALQRKEGEIAPEADIAAGEEFAPALADENVAGQDSLTAVFFHAETFADAVASVLDAALSFFMGHMRLKFDFADFHPRVPLTVTYGAVVAFTAFEFVGNDLRGFALLFEHLGGNFGPLEERIADLHARIIGGEQDFVEGGVRAGFDAEQFDVDHVARLHAELAAAALNDCVRHKVNI